jgi:hypothetical protein
VAVAAIAGAAAWWRSATEEPACDGLVRVSGLHAQWSTPNAIRWTWTVDEGDVDALHEYRVVLGPTREDVETHSAATRTYAPADNPELAFLRLPGTTGLDPVDGTITDELEPGTEYVARLVAIDNLGCASPSNVAIERTAPVANRSVALFRDELAGHAFPIAFARVDDRARAFAGDAFLAYRSVDDPECASPQKMCWQNLRIFDLAVPTRLEQAYGKFAYLEFALRARTVGTPFWSNIMLMYRDGWSSFDPWTVRPDDEWRLVQIPLRALRRDGETPPVEEVDAGGILGFGIGGAWGHGAEVDLDEIVVRY